MITRLRKSDPLVTLVIPALNEVGRVTALHRALNDEMGKVPCRWEAILVDDGSSDGTADAWADVMTKDERLGLVVLSRNFGKEAALMAGLEQARGDVVIPLDADLQDPPAVIGAFLEQWRAGYDMVYGIRRKRRDPIWKRASSRVFYWLLRRMSRIEIPENAGDFRLLDREVVSRLLSLPEVDRYTRGLYHWVGGRSIGVAYDRPARLGETRYRFMSSIDQAISGLSFTDVPLQGVFLLGMVLCLGSLSYGLYCIAYHLSGREMAWGWASLMCAISGMGGIQLLSTGVIGLYLGRIFREVKRRPRHLVASAFGAVKAQR